MLNQWKIYENMNKHLNHFLFWSPKWPGNWASEVDIHHTSKSISNWHLNQDWCETRGNILSKWLKTRNCYLLTDPRWPRNGTCEAYVLNTSKSIRENFLRKWPNNLTLAYFWNQNGPKIGPLRPIFHTCKSTCNEHVKQYWYETNEKVTKVQKCDLLWGQK